MDEITYAIERIQIERFKKIRDLTLEPGEGANVLFGEYRSGKTSLCEFIRFALYGAEAVSFPKGQTEEARGVLWFHRGEDLYRIERNLTNTLEEAIFTNAVTGETVNTDLTPGEYLTGLDRKGFDMIAYFRQARYETPVFRPGISVLDQIAAFQPETENIYRDYLRLKAKANEFTNEEKNGSLDLAAARRDACSKILHKEPERVEKMTQLEQSLEEIAERLDENAKRVVIIKADMANYADDLKLSQNKENAAQLKREIQNKEKRLRLLKYEVSSKAGTLERGDALDLKESYNQLSLSLTELGEARNRLSAAQETLAFHENMFCGRDSAEHFTGEFARIKKEKKKRLWVKVSGVLSFMIGAALGLILLFANFDASVCIAAAGTFSLCGAALFFVAQTFTVSIRRILSENGKKSLEEFQQTYEKLEAHTKTTQVYREALNDAEENCEKKERLVEKIRDEIRNTLAGMGRPVSDDDLLTVCDDVIDANESVYDLEDEIRAGWEEYLAKLAEDVEKDTLEVSPEFESLQKELSFLTKQSETLQRRRENLQDELNTLRAEAADLEAVRCEAEEAEEALRRENHLYEVVKMDLALAESNRARFESKLKEALTLKIQKKLHYLLKEDEGFLFDENFELCYRDKDSVLPVLSLGGGQLAEMGLLAFRLGLAEMLNKNDLPMIFDDPFTYLGTEEIKRFYEILKESCRQFFLSTSSREVANLCGDTAKILTV